MRRIKTWPLNVMINAYWNIHRNAIIPHWTSFFIGPHYKQIQALGPWGTAFYPEAGQAPWEAGLQRFPWKWHPINHRRRFSCGSCRVTVDRWMKWREGRSRHHHYCCSSSPSAASGPQPQHMPLLSSQHTSTPDFMGNKLLHSAVLCSIRWSSKWTNRRLSYCTLCT